MKHGWRTTLSYYVKGYDEKGEKKTIRISAKTAKVLNGCTQVEITYYENLNRLLSYKNVITAYNWKYYQNVLTINEAKDSSSAIENTIVKIQGTIEYNNAGIRNIFLENLLKIFFWKKV